jgi:hypothetical protein
MLSGNKNVDLLILDNIEDRDLFNYCLTDKYAAKLCKNEDFWRNRFLKRFGKVASEYKPKTRSWKNHYLKVVSDLDKYSANPWEFFNEISWNFRDEVRWRNLPNYQEFLDPSFRVQSYREIKYAPEEVQNVYWLLDLGKTVKIDYIIDRYDELDPIVEEYTSETYFTPHTVLEKVREFYNKPLTRSELEEQKDIGNPFADDYSLEEADRGEVKRIDMLGEPFFEGFYNSDKDYHTIMFGT